MRRHRATTGTPGKCDGQTALCSKRTWRVGRRAGTGCTCTAATSVAIADCVQVLCWIWTRTSPPAQKERAVGARDPTRDAQRTDIEAITRESMMTSVGQRYCIARKHLVDSRCVLVWFTVVEPGVSQNRLRRRSCGLGRPVVARSCATREAKRRSQLPHDPRDSNVSRVLPQPSSNERGSHQAHDCT